MKRVGMFLVVGLLVLGLAGSVAAAAPAAPNQNPNQTGWNCPYWGQQQANLTEAQKQDLIAYQNQVLESKKQLMQKQVDLGWITQAQADQYIAAMSQHMVNGAAYGCGMGGGMMNGGMMNGTGMHGGMMGGGMMNGGRGAGCCW